MTSTSLFVEELLRVVPELQPAYSKHLIDNNELLPHVFMGDVTRFVVAEAGNAASRATLARALDIFENGLLNGSQNIKELIVVSFVENLIGEKAALRSLKALMGPNLTKEVEAICE